jgi:hypothetical protein
MRALSKTTQLEESTTISEIISSTADGEDLEVRSNTLITDEITDATNDYKTTMDATKAFASSASSTKDALTTVPGNSKPIQPNTAARLLSYVKRNLVLMALVAFSFILLLFSILCRILVARLLKQKRRR